MSKKISPEIIKELKYLFDQKVPEAGIRRWFRETAGLKKTQGNAVFNQIKESFNKVKTNPDLGLEFISDKYTYNKIDDVYCINLKCQVKPLVVSGSKHRAICRSFSEWGDNLTCDEIVKKYTLTPEIFEEYRRIFNLTKTKEPLSIEEVLENSVEDSVGRILEEKRFKIYQSYEKESWKSVQSQAVKWQDFQARKFDPFVNFLENYNPPELKQFDYKSKFQDINSDRVFTIVLSDLHYGANAKAKYMFNRPDWTTEKTVECVDKFATEIVKEVDNRKSKFKKCVIMGLGDLIHSLDGKTQRGTELKYDYVREEQFDFALDSLLAFITRMVECFGECEVHSIYGNHNYETEMALFRALDCFFRKDKRVKFFHYASRPAAFRIDNTLILMDHGADGRERAYVPAIGAKLEKHVNTLLVNNPELLIGVKTKLFCQGDKHHFCHVEYGSFEFLMFSTSLGGCEHAAVNNLHNRARQSCMVLDKNGLREFIHVYFE